MTVFQIYWLLSLSLTVVLAYVKILYGKQLQWLSWWLVVLPLVIGAALVLIALWFVVELLTPTRKRCHR